MALVSTTGATIKDVEPCVALRTGAQYLDSIAKDRQIFIHGQKISRCGDDAELAKSTRLRADIYDLLSHPEQIGVTGRYDVALGAVVSRLHSAPVSKQCWHDKLSILDMMFQKLAYLPCRVGDETIPAVWSMMDGLEIIAEKNAGFAANVVRHYHHILTHDPYHVSGNADPKTDRSAAAQASGKSNLLRSVGETSEGIVVRGAKYETGADIQHHFLRDLVTPRNPQSHFGFVNFLKMKNRLFDFLNLGIPYALRRDYADYVQWVAGHFEERVRYGQSVRDIVIGCDPRDPSIPLVEIHTEAGDILRARSLVLGTGRTPRVPDAFQPHMGKRIVHFTRYLETVRGWGDDAGINSVAVVGGSQSAVEIILDLSRRMPDVEIHNIQRGFGFRLKDTSPFTEHAYFPDFVDYFYKLGERQQQELTQDLWRSNYSAADHDVISQLYTQLYEQRLAGRSRISLHPHSQTKRVHRCATGGQVKIELENPLLGTRSDVVVDAVILATGFRNFGVGADQELFPHLLKNIAPLARVRESGALWISRDYRIVARDETAASLPPIVLNGLCETTHGFGDAGSFSLLAFRSWAIAESLCACISQQRSMGGCNAGAARYQVPVS